MSSQDMEDLKQYTYPLRHFNSFCYDDDDDDEEYTIAITPEKPVDSLIMEDEHLDTIPETKSDEFIKSSVENLVPTPCKSEDFSDIESECDVPDCDDSQTTNFSTFSNPLFDDSTSSDNESSHEEFIAKIEALKDNPTPSSDFVTKSPSTFLNFFLEETNTFDNSLPESETFCFNLEEISNASPTSYSDLSLPDYEAFFRDSEPDSGDFTMDVVEVSFDNPTREPRVHVPNVLPTHPTFHLDLNFILSSDSLFAYVVWIFLPFLTYPVDTPYLLSSGNEDTIFDPGISIYHSFI
ncbi:hypothetical protein Tco_0138867 [Tanacetum coccineum]